MSTSPPPTHDDPMNSAHQLCMTLNNIMMLINASHDRDEIVLKVVKESFTALGCESAQIAMRECDNWVIRYDNNLPDNLVGRSFTDKELPHAALAMTTRKPVIIDDTTHDDWMKARLMESLGIKAVLTLPLLERNVVTGTLLFGYHSRAESFTDTEKDYAERLTAAVAIALMNACLYQNLAESKRLDEALNEIQQLREREGFKQAILDSLPANIAVLDQQGIIIAVNRSWVLFAEENGLPESSSVCAGIDYLAACRKAADLSDPLAQEALVGIEMVLNKKISNFTLHYPCHSPTSQRWFMMQVVRSNDMQGAVVTHLDITDRIKVENELQDANQELEAFNYSVAHDLRAPLNALSLAFQGIEIFCGDHLNAQCKGFVQNAFNSTLHMNQLLDALLTFSRMGHVEPQREKVNLCALAHEIMTTLQQSEPERQVDVRISDKIEAHGDASLLRVVLNNLLGNAWKFAVRQENAVIEFGVKEIDGVPTYFVRDNGVGFDKADANKLFIPFQRLPGAEISQGFGIGLATVERIIKRHGGKIWAEGEPGKGATFSFTL